MRESAQISRDEKILEGIRFAASMKFGPQVLYDLKIESAVEMVTGSLLLSLQAKVYGKRGRECRKRIVATYPATWWDALKRDIERWTYRTESRRRRKLVRWWLDRHPIRIDARVVTLDFSEQMLFPDNTQVFPESMGDHVVVQTISASVDPLDEVAG